MVQMKYTLIYFMLVFINPCYGDIFTDISVSSGVNIPHEGHVFGIGQAWIDVNNDNHLDVYVTSQEGPNQLLFNQGNETFEAVAGFENLNVSNQACNGVTVADYDNDGWDDIYVTCIGDNYLFKNSQGTGFIDVTTVSGTNDVNNSQVSAWADINNDGWLDLYVVNYNNGLSRINGVNTAKDSLFLSNADGTFININSDLSDINLLKPGLAVTFFDYDNDGDQDLYVVIDRLHGNVLWRNEGPATNQCGQYWCFTDVSIQTHTDASIYGMGISTGDIDLDGDLDMYFTSIGEQVLLISQIAQGSEVFQDVSSSSILNAPGAGWATLFFDYDNDGLLDAALATSGNENSDGDKIFRGLGNGAFTDESVGSGFVDVLFTEGLAFGDFNNDGLLDVLKGNRDSGYSLLKNTVNNTNKWLEFKLVGAGAVNKNAIGSRVIVTTNDGKVIIREVTSGNSRGAGSQLSLHFGIGSASVNTVKIDWADGSQEYFTDYSVNNHNIVLHHSLRGIFTNGFE